MNIEDIIGAICHGRVHITDHAQNEAEEDQLSYDDIFANVFQGTVIEDYPNDNPFPSCLIYGNTHSRDLFTASGPITKKPRAPFWLLSITPTLICELTGA